MTTIDIVVPRRIWKGDPAVYQRWIWETYGRYLRESKSFNLKIRLGWR